MRVHHRRGTAGLPERLDKEVGNLREGRVKKKIKKFLHRRERRPRGNCGKERVEVLSQWWLGSHYRVTVGRLRAGVPRLPLLPTRKSPSQPKRAVAPPPISPSPSPSTRGIKSLPPSIHLVLFSLFFFPRPHTRNTLSACKLVSDPSLLSLHSISSWIYLPWRLAFLWN